MSSCNRRSARPLCLQRVPGGEPQRRSQKLPGHEDGREGVGERARRPKRCLLAMNHFLRDVVAQKLREDWSPEQISGWLKREYSEDQAMRISHETIYRTLFVQARGALKRELLAHLRSRRMMRKGRQTFTAGQPRGQIKRRPSPSASVRPRPRIGRCPDTGRGICWPARATPTLLPWSNAARGS